MRELVWGLDEQFMRYACLGGAIAGYCACGVVFLEDEFGSVNSLYI